MKKTVLIILLFILFPFASNAQQRRQRVYTEEHPLVYEDVWDLWPYCFQNEYGHPEGFNIDLIRLICHELKIPYTIRLKSRQEAFDDLRNGNADLTMALSAGYHDEYGQYGQNTITLFTQSVATPKSKPVVIYNFKDLAKHKVIVNDNSLCQHLMTDYSWGENAQPTKDIKGAIQQLSATEEGQIIWNTLSLKWIIRQNQIDNLQITPVNMPHGEYRFMSNDPQLLNTLDSIFTVLSTDEKLLTIQNKWFYPERQEKSIPRWAWYIVAALGVIGIIFTIYGIIYRVQARRITHDNNRQNKRLAHIMDTYKVHMWTYDVNTQQFTLYNKNGEPASTYPLEEFANHYHPEDFKRLKDKLQELAMLDGKDNKDDTVNIHVKERNTTGGESEWNDFITTLSVHRRDKKGKPSVVIGTKKDITEQTKNQRKEEEQLQRYMSIFKAPTLGIMLFNKDNILTNINKKACEMFHFKHDDILAKQVTYQELSESKEALYKEIQVMPIHGDLQESLGMFAFCRDITLLSEQEDKLCRVTEELSIKNDKLKQYVSNIDYILKKGDVRLLSYSPTLHTLTIYRQVGQKQTVLTQARCMTFIDNRHQRKAMHILSDMDTWTEKEITTDIKTTIRTAGRLTLHLLIILKPVKDKKGNITEYFGLCQDISELKKSEELMKNETSKAQEIENTQNQFLRNMMKEIRTPLNIVVELAGRLQPENSEDSVHNSEIILNNAQQLLELINNILQLSRLEAHMVEIQKQPTDFANQFKSYCMNGWSRYRRDSVRYMVENAYEILEVDIDGGLLGQVIERLAAMSALSTQSGTIRARYDYIGRKLIITIDDTGEGLDEDILKSVYQEYHSGSHTSKGLSISICKETISQMGGTLEINSEEGLGTTVWITLPCQATNIKRKKNG